MTWLVTTACSRAAPLVAPPVVGVVPLTEGWQVQSSAAGEAGGWIALREPMTVGAALFEAGEVPDPYVGDGLRSWPGWAEGLRHDPMPPDSPFAVPWRYRTTFHLDDPAGPALLHLDGLNDRASVWLNGARVGDVRGAFRRFALDVTGRLQRDNVLAIEVSPQGPADLGITWLDWNPTPPDRDLGLYDGVWLERTGPLAIADPWVRVRLADGGAALTVQADVRSLTDRPVDGVWTGTLAGPDGAEVARFERAVHVDAGQTSTVSADVQLVAPALWWPAGLGEQPLYGLDLEVSVGGVASDRDHRRVGVREVASEVVDGVRRFRVNGRPVLIRGAGWSSDLLLRRPPGKLAAQLDLVRDLGLNALRLEGMVEPDAFHQRCDELGILVLSGWSCCDRWEQTGSWTDDELARATATLADRVRALRSHPSTLAFLYGSDHPPIDRVEAAYLAVLRDAWDLPALSAAAEADTPRSGSTGVKMRGPYAPVSPYYWLADRDHGGAFGFATELGPGAAIPSDAGLRALLGADPPWPIDGRWAWHAGPRRFDQLGRLDVEVVRRYGRARGRDDWLRKARLVVYDGWRAMFEAYRANAAAGASGVVAWKLNSAWPSLYWTLYDWDLRPGAAYFAAKEANRPVHGLYRYDDHGVVVVNATADPVEVDVDLRVVGLDGVDRVHEVHRVTVPGRDGVVRVATVPAVREPRLVRVDLRDPLGSLFDANAYWLAAEPDLVDFDRDDPRTDWFVTPTARYGDLRALADLPPAAVGVRVDARPGSVEVTLSNGPTLAVSVALAAVDAAGAEILPVHWSDGHVTLVPGETRTLTATFPGGESASAVQVSGFNVAPTSVPSH